MCEKKVNFSIGIDVARIYLIATFPEQVYGSSSSKYESSF